MEKAKLYTKITGCISLVIMATIVILVSMVFGHIQWQAVATLIATWWLSLIAMSIVIIESRNIAGFVKRTVKHQVSGPKGNFPAWLLMLLALFALGTEAVFLYGKYYVAAIEYGSNFDAATAAGISLLLVALTKTYGYHRYDTKRVNKTNSHEFVSVDSLLA